MHDAPLYLFLLALCTHAPKESVQCSSGGDAPLWNASAKPPATWPDAYLRVSLFGEAFLRMMAVLKNRNTLQCRPPSSGSDAQTRKSLPIH